MARRRWPLTPECAKRRCNTADGDTYAILGAHLVGPDAEEVINVFALASRHGLRSEQMMDAVFAYPTGGYDIAYMSG